MSVEILREPETNVNPDPQEIFDPYEDLINDLHRFLDRLVAESRTRQEFFIGGDDDE